MRRLVAAAMLGLLWPAQAGASCIHVVRHAEAREDSLAFSAGLQREVRMAIDRGGSCTPVVQASFIVVDLAVVAGRSGRGFLVTYAVVDEREGDFRPQMGAIWGIDRTQVLIDAGRSAGAVIRAATPQY